VWSSTATGSAVELSAGSVVVEFEVEFPVTEGEVAAAVTFPEEEVSATGVTVESKEVAAGIVEAEVGLETAGKSDAEGGVTVTFEETSGVDGAASTGEVGTSLEVSLAESTGAVEVEFVEGATGALGASTASGTDAEGLSTVTFVEGEAGTVTGSVVGKVSAEGASVGSGVASVGSVDVVASEATGSVDVAVEVVSSETLA
jgi:hypothetical protein